MEGRRLIVGITGASGALYAVRFLKAALAAGFRLDVIVSGYGLRLLSEECGLNLKSDDFGDWLDRTYGKEDRPGSMTLHPAGDQGAEIASGSGGTAGMVVIPCSMKTLSGIARGAATNLIERAADVTLKERRRLILVPRETPLNLAHIENMRTVTLAGGSIVPAMPAFYQKPETLEDIADFIVGRVLSLLDEPHELYPAWTGRTLE
ncbi:MAG: UbiX family flavin prenyltransferase [Acidobacteria bacterium]|uniref:Flavin prenyltransferase UbiX n=1 Tax=Candidatus Polarisedimenticola svalbardensis TaxID=2886004 RepID=A0A8J7C3K9_9BACT|nr:UbiX family flavin prenyltransferase [Candidatus Polarisedimenticola svalbardensis]